MSPHFSGSGLPQCRVRCSWSWQQVSESRECQVLAGSGLPWAQGQVKMCQVSVVAVVVACIVPAMGPIARGCQIRHAGWQWQVHASRALDHSYGAGHAMSRQRVQLSGGAGSSSLGLCSRSMHSGVPCPHEPLLSNHLSMNYNKPKSLALASKLG